MRRPSTPRGSVATTPSQRRSGFTLIELLVVIAIIAVLAALLFPTFAQARERARRTTCLSNLQQIAKAQLMYAQDWDDRLPNWQYGRPGGPYTFWPEYFQPYTRGTGVFSCPSFRTDASGRPVGSLSWWPELDLARTTRLSDYAFLLLWGTTGGDGSARAPFGQVAAAPLSLAQVRRPSESINIGDGLTTTSYMSAFHLRHDGGFVAAFLDGHARRLTLEQAYEARRDEQGKYYYRYLAADRG